jgi:hypothetical protein
MSRQRFHHRKQDHRPKRHCPIAPDRRGQRDRQTGSQDGADVRDKSKDHRQQPPKRRARNSDDRQTNAYDYAESRIQDELGQEQLSQPLRCIIEGGSGPLQILAAKQSDESVAQILSLKEEEDQKDHHDPRGGEGTHERSQYGDQRLRRRRVRLMDFDRDGRFCRTVWQ